ncbi:hypothetical protein [Streptomyces sp. NBC_01443]|uniref:hypothetical protein n=1 Tax=Streptomyces sp. NBC_01443 TaxID=2903868 RepID=UPI0022542E03|nr:hypothetical protein [Streptomyces sp. NBC_01443]MCX4633002.1 hypothetical protein [Streptomyces sp. NBC_01443]
MRRRRNPETSEECGRRLPTLEIRISDVNADLDTVVPAAMLVRGLAGALLADVDARVPPPLPPEPALRRAHRLYNVLGAPARC